MEAVLSPGGDYVLAVPAHKHEVKGDMTAIAANEISRQPGQLAVKFEEMIATGLRRFARIRSHQRGSEAEQQEIQAVFAETEFDASMPNHCMLDLHAVTQCTMINLGHDLERFKSKLSGVLESTEPTVLSQAAEALGHYAEQNPDFRSGEVARYVADLMTELLFASDDSVRHWAAVALHQLNGEPVTLLEGAELVASAKALWATGP